MPISKRIWRFSALDTWFFKESRPMESIGGSELMSAFPPSPRTLAGALRSVVGHKHNVDWKEWKQDSSYPELKARIGNHEHLGNLKLQGPWFSLKTEAGYKRLFPAPANLVAKLTIDGEVEQVMRMKVSEPRYSDLGEDVCLPLMPDTGAKPALLSDYWLTESALHEVLQGGVCRPDELISSKQLYETEVRLGIARNNQNKTVETGLLYQTRHIRPKDEVYLELDVTGLEKDDYNREGVVKLGGEGRGASYHVELANSQVQTNTHLASHLSQGCGITLTLLSHAHIPAVNDLGNYAPLPNFVCERVNNKTVWIGDINGINLQLHCVVQNKMVREGGWDLVNNQPRAVQSLTPAGTVFYVTPSDGDIESAIQNLHLQQISTGVDQALGRGLLAAGIWPISEMTIQE